MREIGVVAGELERFLATKNATEYGAAISCLQRLKDDNQALSLLLLVFRQADLQSTLALLTEKQAAQDIVAKHFGTTFEVCFGCQRQSPTSIHAVMLEQSSHLPPMRMLVISPDRLNQLALQEYTACHEYASLGVVAAPQHMALDQSALGAFNLFTDAIETAAFWVLPTTDNQDSGSWLNTPIPQSLSILPAKRLNVRDDLPVFITDEQDATRLSLIDQFRIASVSRLLDAINADFDKLQQRLRDRLMLTAFEFTEQEKSRESEVEIKTSQTHVDEFVDSFKKLVKSSKRDSKEKLIGRGLYFQLLEAELSGLDVESIEEEKNHNSHHLTLKNHVFEHIQQRLWDQVRTEVADANQKQLRRAEELIQTLNSRVSFLDKAACLEMIDKFSDTQHVDGLREYMDIKPRYRGERPARGILKRLGEGRRSVFMVLMTLSIFGTMVGFNYRDYAFIGFIFLLIFVFSFAYTFYSWKRDDRLLLEKELDKLRDQLHTDFQRAINEIERENVRECEEKANDVRETVSKRHATASKNTSEGQKDALQAAKKQRSEKESIIKQLLEDARGAEEALADIANSFNQIRDTEKKRA